MKHKHKYKTYMTKIKLSCFVAASLKTIGKKEKKVQPAQKCLIFSSLFIEFSSVLSPHNHTHATTGLAY
jgi:hypothetical protein